MGAMSDEEPDLAARGKSIFDRLRSSMTPGEPEDRDEIPSADQLAAEAPVSAPPHLDDPLPETDGPAEAPPGAHSEDPPLPEDLAPDEAGPSERALEAGGDAITPAVQGGNDADPSEFDAPSPVADSDGQPVPAGPGEAPAAASVAVSASEPFAEPVREALADAIDDALPAVAAPTSGGLDDYGHFRRPLPRVLAIANQKGGVGKTTTAVNLSAALAELGYRVLVIDLDPQGNATTGLGINPRNLENSVYDVIMQDLPLEDCIEPTSLKNLFVVPATIDLAGAEIELVPAFSRELKLKKAIESLDDQFDFTLIDCPPSLGLITINGLAAATEVVVPIQCEYYALEGLGQLLRNVKLVQGNLNPGLDVSAIILTMYDARTKLAEQVANDVRTHFGPKVCRHVVPRTVRLSEAPSFGQPIIVFDPVSRGAIAYRELAKEVSGGAPQRIG